MPAIAWWLPALPALANFLFTEAYGHRMGRYSVGFVHPRNLLVVAGRLAALGARPAGKIEPLARLRAARSSGCAAGSGSWAWTRRART